MTPYALSLWLHIGAGSLALLLFWTAAMLRKGTGLHRRIGHVYLIAMCGVIVTGVPLALALLERGRPVGALFLTYLLLLVASTCWSAWRAIRDRQAPARYFGPVYWCFAGLVALYGLFLLSLGLREGARLLVVFGGIGPLAALGAWRAWRRAPNDPMWWLREHYGAMIGNGVATHIAFIGIGLRNAVPWLEPQLLQAIAWFGPLLAALLAAWWLDRRYGRTPRRARAPHGAQPIG